MTKKIIFSSGGTGGHMYPAIHLMKYFSNKGYETLLVTDERCRHYLKKNPEDANFILHDEIKRNEFIPALFTSKTLQKEKVVKEPTYASAPRINLEVKEDDIVIYPSKTPHGTDQTHNNNERIS